MTQPIKLLVRLLLSLLVGFAASTHAGGDDALWQGLRNGTHVAVIRHALAPGTGDPQSFRLDDCSTQRNLSEAGRKQARAIGQRFRDHGIGVASVFSSQWCRCLETARLLELGETVGAAALNSFFSDRSGEQAQTQAVRTLLARESHRGRPIVLVTHQVNISALSGVYPASGEIVFLRVAGDGLSVAGRIATALPGE